jgi:Transglycosylase SLT domain
VLLAALLIVLVVALAVSAGGAAAESSSGGENVVLPGPHNEWDAVILDACAGTGLTDPHWPVIIKAIILQESGWNPTAGGDAGQSIGLMQVDIEYHPEWTREELQDPETNIRAGVAILRDCYAQWRDPWVAVRCYNGCVDAVGGHAQDCADPSGYWGYVRSVLAIARGYAARAQIQLPAVPPGLG